MTCYLFSIESKQFEVSAALSSEPSLQFVWQMFVFDYPIISVLTGCLGRYERYKLEFSYYIYNWLVKQKKCIKAFFITVYCF